MKFKKGDHIVPVDSYQGFENSKVIDIFEIDGKKFYKLKILCGTATIPVSAEDYYKLKEKDE